MIQLANIIRENPGAVFIRKTDALDINDSEGFYRGGYSIARDVFVKTEGLEEKLVLKPNITVPPPVDNQGKIVDGVGGIVTNAHFMFGIIDYLKELEADDVLVAEGGGNMGLSYELWGYEKLASPRGIPLVNLTKSEYQPDELNWVTVDGVVMKDIPLVSPIGSEHSLLINVPKMKTHNLGITTLCCKNFQGAIATGYRHFCAGLAGVENYSPEILKHFQPNLKEAVLANYKRHLAEGFPLWDKGDSRDEIWAQRIGDALLAIKPWFNIVEGVIGRDGTAFRQGKDVLCNLVVCGVHPVHVDAVTTYLMGHNPERVNYLMIARERRLGKINPSEIDVYIFGDGGVSKCTDLDSIGICKLGVYHYGDSSGYLFF